MAKERPLPQNGYRAFPNSGWRNWMQDAFEVPLLVAILSLPTGCSILEIGCGRGIALPTLARLTRPARMVGLDIDRYLLTEAGERLRMRHIPGELVQADVREMPFVAGSFNVIIDFGACYHITRSDLALEEIGRVLSDGGVLVYETPLAQLAAHPMGWSWRSLPWRTVSVLRPAKNAVFWQSRVKDVARVR